MNSKKLIGYIGVIGSGKDYRCLNELKKGNSFKFDFSDGVRELTFGFLGMKPLSGEEYEKWKIKEHNLSINEKSEKIQGRKFLENVGITMRKYKNDFWAKYCYKKIYEFFLHDYGEIAIVNAIRYIEEAECAFLAAKLNHVKCQFIFCDYHSNRYEIRDNDSEKFAQSFIDKGFKDGDDITKEVLRLIKDYNFNK